MTGKIKIGGRRQGKAAALMQRVFDARLAGQRVAVFRTVDGVPSMAVLEPVKNVTPPPVKKEQDYGQSA